MFSFFSSLSSEICGEKRGEGIEQKTQIFVAPLSTCRGMKEFMSSMLHATQYSRKRNNAKFTPFSRTHTHTHTRTHALSCMQKREGKRERERDLQNKWISEGNNNRGKRRITLSFWGAKRNKEREERKTEKESEGKRERERDRRERHENEGERIQKRR